MHFSEYTIHLFFKEIFSLKFNKVKRNKKNEIILFYVLKKQQRKCCLFEVPDKNKVWILVIKTTEIK